MDYDRDGKEEFGMIEEGKSEPSFLNDKKEWLCMCENNKKRCL